MAINPLPAGKRFSSEIPRSADSPSLFQKTPTAVVPLGRTPWIKKKNLVDETRRVTCSKLLKLGAGYVGIHGIFGKTFMGIFGKTKQNLN